MSEHLVITRTDFASMENHIGAAIAKKNVAVFIDDENGTAFKQVEDWLAAQQPTKLYLGWDKRVYPRFAIEEIKND